MQVKTAIVTGASSGIGAAIVQRLLAQGWAVHGVARRVTTFESPQYQSHECDLTDKVARRRLIATFPHVNAFIHAAGLLKTGRLGALEDAEDMWELHVGAAQDFSNALAPNMQRGDKIIFIGSRTATGSATRSQYAATKAALVAMARSYALELIERGITVNIVAPAATDTPMLHDPSRQNLTPKLPPLGRFIMPEEVAGAVVYLLSSEADAITGQVLTICGGSSL